MTAHTRPTNKQRQMARELLADQAREIQDEAAVRAIIMCVYCVWQTYHIGRDRMPRLLEMMDKFADKALRDDTWIEETVAALNEKLGLGLHVKE